MNELSTSDWVVLVVIALPFVVVWIGTIIEVVRRPDLRGLRFVVWVVVLLFFPLVAVAAYVVVRRPLPKTIDATVGATTRAEQFVELAEQRQVGQIDDRAFKVRAAGLLPGTPSSGE